MVNRDFPRDSAPWKGLVKNHAEARPLTICHCWQFFYGMIANLRKKAGLLFPPAVGLWLE